MEKDMGIIEYWKDEILYYQIEGFNLKYNINYEDEQISDIDIPKSLIFNKRMNHIFSSRIGWNQEKIFEDLSKVLEIPEEKIYRTKQVHGNKVLIIKDQDSSS